MFDKECVNEGVLGGVLWGFIRRCVERSYVERVCDLAVFGGVSLDIVVDEGREVGGKGRARSILAHWQQQLSVHWMRVGHGIECVRERGVWKGLLDCAGR